MAGAGANTRNRAALDFVQQIDLAGRDFGASGDVRPSPAFRNPAASAGPQSNAGGGRRVLMIATRFPPSPAVGAIRIRKFVKYLGEFGWQPVVVTGPASRGDGDELAWDELPANIHVTRIPAWCDHWPRVISRRIATLIHRASYIDIRATRAGIEWRLQRFFNGLSFPDRNIWRIGAAVNRIVRLHQLHRFDAIFSSGMPFSDHIVALVAQSILRIPWIADFRDPWAEYIHAPTASGVLQRHMTSWAEAAVVHRAARVVSVNDAMTARFRERYRGIRPDRFVTVENGFDPADFAGADSSTARSEFRILHAGSFYGKRSPAKLLAAFQRFVERTPGARARATLDFAGRLGEHKGLIQTSAANGGVRAVGLLPHATAAQSIAEADVNVVILPNVKGGGLDSTAKIYECLGSRRPLLALVPSNGAAAQLLRGFEGVWQCDPDDIEGAATAIGDIYRRRLIDNLKPRPNSPALENLTRRSQTRRLAAHLNAIAPSRRGVPASFRAIARGYHP